MSRSLKLLLVVQLFQAFRGGIISPILALFIRRQGVSVTQLGLLGTAGMMGWLLIFTVTPNQLVLWTRSTQ